MIVMDMDNTVGQTDRPGEEDLRRQVRQQAQAVSDLIRRLRRTDAGPKAVGIIRTIAATALQPQPALPV